MLYLSRYSTRFLRPLEIGADQRIVLLQTRADADRIADRMTAEGHKVISLHGNVEPAGRDAIMTSFREGKTKVLVATDVISRGIDVMQVNMVVNYDMPVDASGRPDPETYLHRIGSSFCSPHFYYSPFLENVELINSQQNRSNGTIRSKRNIDQLRS